MPVSARLAVLWLVGCLVCALPSDAQFLARFTNPKVDLTMVHPPSLGLTVERAAFPEPRDVDCAREFHDAVAGSFVHNGVEVVDRLHLEKILKEIDFGASSYVDPSTTTALGEFLGPSVLVVLDVQRCAIDHSRDVTRIPTKKGVISVYEAVTSGSFRGTLRIIDLATTRVFTLKTVEGSAVEKHTSRDGYPAYPAEYGVRDRMIHEAAVDVHRLFFPWSEQRSLVFFNDDECGLREAYHRMEMGDLQGAAAVSRRAVATCREDPSVKPKFRARAFYNLGMTHFVQGDYAGALAQLEQAYRIDDGSIIRESMSECRRAQALALAMQEVEGGPAPAAALTATVASATIAPVGSAATPPAAAAPGDDSVAARLERLQSLYDQGLLTTAEYEAKRAEILADL